MEKKRAILLLLSIFFGSCSNLKEDYKNTISEINVYEDVTKNYNFNKEWWKEYKDLELNRIIELGIKNNKDLAKAAISINKALYQANLIGTNLVPEFSGDFNSTASKNIKNGSKSLLSHSGEVNVSYEVDLWKRLADMQNAEEWEYKATVQDFEETKLILINNIIDTYFSIMYLENYINISKNMVENYSQIEKITLNKFKYGTGDILDTKEAEKEVIRSKNDVLLYMREKKEQEILLKNLLNLKPDEELKISYKQIVKVSNIGIDLNIPIEVIANRPDIKAYEFRLKSNFKNAIASEKQLYPNITISSSLSSSNEKIKSIFNGPVTLGGVNVNLPFLNWNEIKWNIKTDQANYNEARENFQQGITTALNEIDYNYFLYIKDQESYNNAIKINNYDKEIAKSYNKRYENGKSELKDWLMALNNEANSKLEVLNLKYQLLKIENTIYESMGGKAEIIE